MSKIFVKRFKEPIEVDRSTADNIAKLRWGPTAVEPKMPLTIGDTFMGEVGDVTNIDMRGGGETARADRNQKYYDEENRSFMVYRQEQLKKSPQQRAQSLSIFKIIWQAFTGQIVPFQEFQEEAKKIQEKFFEKNPKRMYCDPILFLHMFKKNSPADGAFIRLVENIIRDDMREARIKNKV